MKAVALRFLFLMFQVSLIAGCFSCTEEDASDPIPNSLVGVWTYDDEASDIWVSLEFNEDLTGIRTDSDGEHQEFRYIFTQTTITFAGDVSGTYNHVIADGPSLHLFNNIFIKQ